MAAVAEALGVAKGTVYRYVESKEALVDAVVRFADEDAPDLREISLPLAIPDATGTIRFIRERLERETPPGARLFGYFGCLTSASLSRQSRKKQLEIGEQALARDLPLQAQLLSDVR